jgi:hypothetical protein
VSEGNVTVNGSAALVICDVQALREGSLATGEHIMYNAYMQDAIKKTFCAGKHSRFWSMVVDDKVSLISTRDTFLPGAASEADADRFLSSDEVEQVVAAVAVAVEVAPDDDDLFADMA